LDTPGHRLLAIHAASDGRRVGEAWIEHRIEDDQPICVILYLRIEPSERRRGFGRAALHALEALARQAGESAIRLTVGGRNEAARALYDSVGFHMLTARLSKTLMP
jgi:ribosomal protein S18 acetylase RimI-like enzyme